MKGRLEDLPKGRRHDNHVDAEMTACEGQW
jgi:hypothetical protein